MSRHPSRPSRNPVDGPRAEAAAAVAASSLRAVARQVGMSADGLRKVLDGATPTPPVSRKLRAWYDRRLRAGSGDADGAPATPATRSPAPADQPETDEVDLGDVPRVVLHFTRSGPG